MDWQSLDGRRQDQRLVLFYKIINGLASVETEDILTPADSRTRNNNNNNIYLKSNIHSITRYKFIRLYKKHGIHNLAVQCILKYQEKAST